MWSSTSIASAVLLTGISQAAAPLAQIGENIHGSTVVELIDHPEFHRIIVQLEDQTTLTIELVATDTPLGACTHHGFAVQPRWELRNQTNQTIEDQPPVVAALCDRLSAAPPQLALAPPAGEGAAPPAPTADQPRASRPSVDPQQLATERFHASDGPKAPTFRPLHGVLGVLFVTLFFAAPPLWRRQAIAYPAGARAAYRELLAVTLIGLLARLMLGLQAPLWSPMFGFGRFGMVLGGFAPVSGYGDGFTATMTALSALFGATTTTILAANLILGTLVPPLIWGTVRALAPEHKLAPVGAALLAALLPVHVWISATEAMHVSLVTYEVLAFLAAALFLRHAATHWFASMGFALVSALATVMAVHTRPEAIPFALVPALLVLLHTRRVHLLGIGLASAVTSMGVLLRLAEMSFDVSDEASAVRYDMLRETSTWLHLLLPDLGPTTGSSATSVLMRPTLTSPLLPLLALVGLWKAPRALAAALAAWWALTIVPVLPKAWPLADAYRLQAASLMPMVVLAGLGLEPVVDWVRRLRPSLPRSPLVVGALLALLGSPQLFLERPSWGTLDESRLLMRAIPDLAPSATVLFADTHPHASTVAIWGAFAAPGTTWRPISRHTHDAETSEPLLAWLGSTCHDAELVRHPNTTSQACARIREACTLTPVAVAMLPLTADIDRRFTVAEAEVGFHRLTDCSFPPTAADAEQPTTP